MARKSGATNSANSDIAGTIDASASERANPIDGFSGITGDGNGPAIGIEGSEFGSESNEGIAETNGSGQGGAESGETKKKRGRPRKIIEGSEPSAGPARPAGTAKKARLALDAEALAGQIFFAHFLLGSAMKMPELMLSEDESKSLSGAVINFAKEFDFVPDPKITAAIMLIGTAGMIYAPKVMAIKARLAELKKRNRMSPVESVIQTGETIEH